MPRHLLNLLIATILLFTLVPGLHAQFYEYGQDRGTIRWNSFSSDHYKFIYPRGLDSLAMDFADKMEYYYPYQAEVLDHRHSTIPVIFHNEASFSNGVFVWAPKRLEVFTNPDPNGYPQDWMTELALHEGRHAFQVSKLNQGVARALSLLVGEQSVGAFTGFLPMWYLEGDAVDAETRFSYSGRGRLPEFEMGMKSILLENDQPYNFSKALLGSYKDHVPNHYELGYLMVRYGRRTYGDSFWTDMENYAARRPYLVVPTWFSMKKYGVRSKYALYESTMELYGAHWEESFRERMVSEPARVSVARNRHYTNYRFPQWMNDSMVIALKTGLDQIPEFVSIDPMGEEKRIFRPGIMNSGRFSYSNGLMVWDEWVPDIRWSNRNFSVLRLLDLSDGSVQYLGYQTRYYSPVLSGDGSRIAATEQRTDHSFRLVILDLEGNVLHSARSPGNMFIQHPAWMEQDSAVVVIAADDKGKTLYKYSPGRGQWEKLFYSGFDDMLYPEAGPDGIYFSATFAGINDIYRLGTGDQYPQKLTSVAFGAFDPNLDSTGKKLLLSDYHSQGYRAAAIDLDTVHPLMVTEAVVSTEQIDAVPTPREREIIEGAAEMERGVYEPRPYMKLSHVINIHSWLPLYFDYLDPEAALTPEQLPVSPGVTLLSQNLLSTAVGMLGYEYREGMHHIHSGLRLKGRYPVLDLRADYGGLPTVYKMDPSDDVPVSPNRLTFSSHAYMPLRLNTGKYITYLQPLAGYFYSSDLFPNEQGTGYERGSHRFLYRFYASTYLRKSKMDILPRLGLTVNAGYRNAPFNAHNFGSLKVAGATVYLPGPLRHQTFKLRYTLQMQDPERYLFGNDIALPRGYKDLVGLDMKFYSADYTFPVMYPDLNIEPLVYIKRIRGNIWGDYLVGKDMLITDPVPSLQDRNYLSVGADLLFDLHFLRIFTEFSMGIRVSYLPENGDLVPEFLFMNEFF